MYNLVTLMLILFINFTVHAEESSDNSVNGSVATETSAEAEVNEFLQKETAEGATQDVEPVVDLDTEEVEEEPAWDEL